MQPKIICILLALCISVASATITTEPCPFNAQCQCNLTETVVQCDNADTFPVFADYNKTLIRLIIINGNFQSIPSRAFFPLKTLYGANVYIQRTVGNTDTNFNIDPQAFVTALPDAIYALEFDYYSMTSIPSGALANLKCNQLSFLYGTLQNGLGPQAFAGMSTSELMILSNGLAYIDPQAFQGLKVNQGTTLTLFFDYNSLTEISTAFKTVDVVVLYLEYNNISKIEDFAFSSCDAIGACTNALSVLYLDNNPISSIGANAFGNLPNLNQLYLGQTKLNQIPTASLQQVAAGLISVSFPYSNIKTVAANTFYGFSKLTSLTLDWNPIEKIDVGAFNGVSSLIVLTFQGLTKLQTVDMLITYGMSRVATLEFQYCVKLHTLQLSDVSKLPASLQTVTLSVSNDIRNVDSTVQYWLQQSQSKTLDISNANNFNCDNDIDWMAKYVICAPQQILVDFSFCANTNQTLLSYMGNLNPTCGS